VAKGTARPRPVQDRPLTPRGNNNLLPWSDVSPSADTCGDTAGPGQPYALANVRELMARAELRARRGVTGRPRTSTDPAGSSQDSAGPLRANTPAKVAGRFPRWARRRLA
jgi:hypothetical protein